MNNFEYWLFKDALSTSRDTFWWYLNPTVKEKYSKSLKGLNNTLPTYSRKWDIYRHFYAFENLLLSTTVQMYKIPKEVNYMQCTICNFKLKFMNNSWALSTCRIINKQIIIAVYLYWVFFSSYKLLFPCFSRDVTCLKMLSNLFFLNTILAGNHIENSIVVLVRIICGIIPLCLSLEIGSSCWILFRQNSVGNFENSLKTL